MVGNFRVPNRGGIAMTVLALIFGIVALVVFIIEGVRSRALIPWGLAAFVAMVMAQWLIEGGDTVTL